MPFAPPVHRPLGVQTASARRAAYDAARQQEHGRWYGHRWRKLRDAYLATHPLCECDDPDCRRPAQVVDHRKPHNGNDELLFAWTNLQAMTKACHDRKTATHDGGFGNPRR